MSYPYLKSLSHYISKYWLLSICGTFCLIGSYFSVHWGLANLKYYYAKNYIADWYRSPENLFNYQAVKAKAQAANRQHSSHPLYLETYAQIIELGYISEKENHETLRVAKYKYLSALQIRPVWPVTWASLAMLKWRMNELDEEMLFYLERANSYGQHNAEAHVLFTELGLSLYKYNHPWELTLRNQIKHHIQLGLTNKHSRDRIVASIVNQRLEKPVCRWLSHANIHIKQRIPGCKEL